MSGWILQCHFGRPGRGKIWPNSFWEVGQSWWRILKPPTADNVRRFYTEDKRKKELEVLKHRGVVALPQVRSKKNPTSSRRSDDGSRSDAREVNRWREGHLVVRRCRLLVRRRSTRTSSAAANKITPSLDPGVIKNASYFIQSCL